MTSFVSCFGKSATDIVGVCIVSHSNSYHYSNFVYPITKINKAGWIFPKITRVPQQSLWCDSVEIG